MQKHLQTQDTNQVEPGDDVFVIRKPYSQKKIPHVHTRKRLGVSLTSFRGDLHLFDQEMRDKYTNPQITTVMKLIWKKAAERIIQKLWRMPFPNGIGSLYMKEAQISNPGITTGGKITSDQQLEALLREVRLGMKRVFLKWNKEGRRFSYKNIWQMSMSKGFMRSLKFNEIVDRAEDPTKKNYRGHII